MNKNRALMSLSTNILVNNNISSLYSIGLESSLEDLDDAGILNKLYNFTNFYKI